MMSRTHITVGIATSMVIMQPKTPEQCILAISGGALGGVIADIDTVKNDYKHDALFGQLAAVGLTFLLLLIDFILNVGIVKNIVADWGSVTIAGLVGYILLSVYGYFTNHRTFTHSLLSMVLFSLCIILVYQELGIPFILGYLSHLTLDIMNKKDVPLLYPKGKGFCLKWFYAGKTANTVFMWSGLIVSVAMIGYTIFGWL